MTNSTDGTYRRYDGDPADHEYGDARVGYNVPKEARHGGAYRPMEKRELSGNGTSLRGHCAAFECPHCGHVQRFATNEFVTWGECRGCSTRSVAFEFKWRLNR